MYESYNTRDLEDFLREITKNSNWEDNRFEDNRLRDNDAISTIINIIKNKKVSKKQNIHLPRSPGIRINIIPGNDESSCQPILFVIIMPKADVEKILLQVNYHIDNCKSHLKAIVFLRMRWDIHAWNKYKKLFIQKCPSTTDFYLCEPQCGPNGGFHKVN